MLIIFQLLIVLVCLKYTNVMDINELFFLGTNKYGQAGIGEKYHYKTFNQPKSFAFPVFVRQISCGAHHAALLTIDGQIYTMGSNIHGALGSNPALNYSFVPTLVEGLQDIEKIDCGPFHMCGISKGQLYSWGKGIDGQLGHGNTKNISKPTKVQALTEVVDRVSCGTNHTLVLTKNNQKTCCFAFGNGIYGQLGTGQSRNSYIPTRVKLDNVQLLSAGDNHSLFVVDGDVYACGDNSNSQLGTALHKKFMSQPIKVQFKENVGKIVSIQAKKYSAALSDTGDIYIWGLKAGFGAPKKLRSKASFNQSIYDIRIGAQCVYGLTTEGALFAWNVHKGQQMQNYWVCPTQKLLDNGRPIFDFSSGQGYLLILGDIIKQIPPTNQIPINLSLIEDTECIQKNRPQNQAQYLKTYDHISESQLVQEKQSVASNPSLEIQNNQILKPTITSKQKQNYNNKQQKDKAIKVQHRGALAQIKNFHNLQNNRSSSMEKSKRSFEISKIPAPMKSQSLEIPIELSEFQQNTFELIKTPSSSILVEPCNFLKESYREETKYPNKLEKSPSLHVKNSQDSKENYQNFQNKTNNVMAVSVLSENRRSGVSQTKKQKYQKIDQVLTMLEKSNSLGSKLTEYVMDDEKGKESQIIKTNRVLRVELKQKQLKISQLQELLSRKQMEIQAQRQIIKMLRQKNQSHYASIQK